MGGREPIMTMYTLFILLMVGRLIEGVLCAVTNPDKSQQLSINGYLELNGFNIVSKVCEVIAMLIGVHIMWVVIHLRLQIKTLLTYQLDDNVYEKAYAR